MGKQQNHAILTGKFFYPMFIEQRRDVCISKKVDIYIRRIDGVIFTFAILSEQIWTAELNCVGNYSRIFAYAMILASHSSS